MMSDPPPHRWNPRVRSVPATIPIPSNAFTVTYHPADECADIITPIFFFSPLPVKTPSFCKKKNKHEKPFPSSLKQTMNVKICQNRYHYADAEHLRGHCQHHCHLQQQQQKQQQTNLPNHNTRCVLHCNVFANGEMFKCVRIHIIDAPLSMLTTRSPCPLAVVSMTACLLPCVCVFFMVHFRMRTLSMWRSCGVLTICCPVFLFLFN